MSLQKKIVLSFLVSAFIIAIMAGLLSINFIEIKNETTFLELTDTIRSKSLQLRRHEKNYFLYAPAKAEDESRAIHAYLKDLDDVIGGMKPSIKERAASLKVLVGEYRQQFSAIEGLMGIIAGESAALKRTSPAYVKASRLIEANFLDKPLEDVRYLQEVLSVKPDHPMIASLKKLDTGITALRKTGETILTVSKELDKTARDKVDSFIRTSRVVILVFFPLFLVVGFGTFLFIISNVVRRLKLLTDIVVRTGQGNFSHMPPASRGWTGHDEVETLINTFNTMEEQLEQREKELLQSKKLAAIGTFASGVAHELNNPLNNVYTTAQRLMKKTDADSPEYIRRGLEDIFSQTMRVKSIVGDLLDFARGREPHPMAIELGSLLGNVYRHIGSTIATAQVRFRLDLHPEEIVIYADLEQLERVFINLFINAVDAMSGTGDLSVRADEGDTAVMIRVSDTGAGISPEKLEKIFEPFYSTKDKGTGLGLAIVFNIIQRHHGEIGVESAEGSGTTFTIKLPKGQGNNG
ncbi:MAG: sensor histidine kinase [Nitrospirae bacterium]|nr:MAG: sensor histidine kinase [Nitrospirota bacterium]